MWIKLWITFKTGIIEKSKNRTFNHASFYCTTVLFIRLEKYCFTGVKCFCVAVWKVAKMMKKQVVIVKLLNAILLYYFYMGHSLHCKVVLLDTKRAYLMFPRLNSIGCDMPF